MINKDDVNNILFKEGVFINNDNIYNGPKCCENCSNRLAAIKNKTTLICNCTLPYLENPIT